MSSEKTFGTQSIHRVAQILRTLSFSQNGLRLVDVSEAAQLSRPTAHRILQALVQEGLVKHDFGNRRYYLGPTVFELGLAATPRFDTRALCAPSLDRLADETGDTAFLTSRSGFDSVCLDRREGHYPIRALTVEVGGRRPLGTTAGSLALLCELPEAERETVLNFNSLRLSQYGFLNEAVLRAIITRSLELGYALNLDDITPGVTGIGVPVPNKFGTPFIAVSVVALSWRLQEPNRSNTVELLRQEAHAIAERLTATLQE